MRFKRYLLLTLGIGLLIFPVNAKALLPEEITIYKSGQRSEALYADGSFYSTKNVTQEAIYDTAANLIKNGYDYEPSEPLHKYYYYNVECAVTTEYFQNAKGYSYTGQSKKWKVYATGNNVDNAKAKCINKLADKIDANFYKIITENGVMQGKRLVSTEQIKSDLKSLNVAPQNNSYYEVKNSHDKNPRYCGRNPQETLVNPIYLKSNPSPSMCGDPTPTINYYQAISKKTVNVSTLKIDSPIFKAEAGDEEIGYAYCLSPGLPFGSNNTSSLTYTKETKIDFSRCLSNNNPYCQLSYIAKNAENYSVALTAMRLAVANIHDNGDYNDLSDLGIVYSNSKKDSLFKKTLQIVNNYNPKTAKAGGYLYSDNDTMEKAIKLYKEALNPKNYGNDVDTIFEVGKWAIKENALTVLIISNLSIDAKIENVTLDYSIPLTYETGKCSDSDYMCITLTVKDYDKYKEYFEGEGVYAYFDLGENSKNYKNMAIYENGTNQVMFVFEENDKMPKVLIRTIPKTCQKVGISPNATYYDRDGNVTDQSTYESQCLCGKREDGNYYDDKGNLLGSDEDARKRMIEICDGNTSKKTTCDEIISTCNSSQSKTVTCDEIKAVCNSSQANAAICAELTKSCNSNSSKTSTCDEIIKTCNSNPDKPSTCEVKPVVKMPDDCGEDGTNTEGVIEDPQMCTILQSASTKAKYKTALGNDYCDIYCRNSYKFRFMSKTEVLSGRFFQYDVYSKYVDHTDPNKQYLSTVVTVTKECTSDIDYNSWKKDFLAAYDDVRSKWNEYQAIAIQVSKAQRQSKTATCNAVARTAVCSTYCPKYECEEYECKSFNTDGSCKEYYTDDNHCSKRYTDNEHCIDLKVTAGDGCNSKNETCTYYTWNDAIYKSTDSNGSTRLVNVSGSSDCVVTCDTNDCDGCRNSVVNGGSPVMGNQKKEYDAAVNKVNTLLTKIKNCNMTADSNAYANLVNEVSSYINNNRLDISYSESYPIETGASEVLNKLDSTTYEEEWKYGQHENINTYCASCDEGLSSLGVTSLKDTVPTWNCTGSGTSAECKLKNEEIPSNKVVDYVLTTEVVYYQNTPFSANLYTGNIVNSPGGDNRVDLGIHVYPVDRQKTTDNKSVIVRYRNDIDNQDRTYTCQYNVISELPTYACDDGHHICPPGFASDMTSGGEFGLYFRNVNLNNLFTNGVPYNWSGFANSKIIDNIQNLGDDLWAETPAYSVTLTPSDISSIRRYNKTTESNGGYMDNSISCKGYNCKSTFIETTLKDLIGAEKIKDNVNEFNVHLYSNR